MAKKKNITIVSINLIIINIFFFFADEKGIATHLTFSIATIGLLSLAFVLARKYRKLIQQSLIFLLVSYLTYSISLFIIFLYRVPIRNEFNALDLVGLPFVITMIYYIFFWLPMGIINLTLYRCNCKMLSKKTGRTNE